MFGLTIKNPVRLTWNEVNFYFGKISWSLPKKKVLQFVKQSSFKNTRYQMVLLNISTYITIWYIKTVTSFQMIVSCGYKNIKSIISVNKAFWCHAAFIQIISIVYYRENLFAIRAITTFVLYSHISLFYAYSPNGSILKYIILLFIFTETICETLFHCKPL